VAAVRVPIDDARLDPIWAHAGKIGAPVLMHVSDPVGFFQPADETNEHYLSLREFPGWSFADAMADKEQLLAERHRMIRKHPETSFTLPHVANHPEHLASVAALLDAHPNVTIDISARIDELGRQPYSSREFLVRYRDRVVFGLDMPVSPEAYRVTYRFLETYDEYFEYPDYIGRFGVFCRWRIHGIGLPDEVLRRLYFENACRLIPGIERPTGAPA
jgi:predicted TIM-barrel fold metal-dependent hydrolase